MGPKPTDWGNVTEEQVFAFARDTIGSVWALELLLVLQRDQQRTWDVDGLVLELRSSEAVIVPCLAKLKTAGLAIEQDDKTFRYEARTPALDHICRELARIYANRPMALAKAIMRAPNEKLSVFSNAFKLKD